MARRERWTRPIIAEAMEPQVELRPDKNSVRDAPDYDRKTAFAAAARRRKFNAVMTLQLGIFGSLAVYASLSFGDFGSWAAVAKVVPVVCMLLLVLKVGNAGTYAVRLACGLGLCAVGDFCLELEGSPKCSDWPLFLLGLCAFLFGHCAYIFAFCANRTRVTALIAAPPLAYAGTVFKVLQPSLPPELFWPVLAYGAVIACMLVTSLSRQPEGFASLSSWRWAALGALLFVASDTLLAYNRFVSSSMPHAKLAILSSYYAAQYSLVMSARGAQARPLTQALGSVENFARLSKSK